MKDIEYVFKRDFARLKHYEEVENKVGDLVCDLFLILIFCGDNGFGTFFAALFKNFVDALFEQIAGLRAFLRIFTAKAYSLVEVEQSFDLFFHIRFPPQFSLISLKKQV